jgi:hypothetical protein
MKILNPAFTFAILFLFIFNISNFKIVTPVFPSGQSLNNNLLCDCELQIDEDINIQLGDSFQINPVFSCPFNEIESISWSPADFLSCTDCVDPIVQPLADQCYTMSVTFTDGCTTTDEFCVFLRSCDSPFSENAINSINPQQINDQAEIELEIARTQFVHLEIVEDDVVQYVIWEGFLKAGLRTLTLDFSTVPTGDHQLRARLYPEDKVINIVKL